MLIPDKPVVLFDYRETRQARWPKEILCDFRGHLQTDGYKGYDWVDRESNIIHLGCMAHARRPFAELVKLAKKTVGKSHQAVAYFHKLYAIEKIAREGHFTHEQRYQLRMVGIFLTIYGICLKTSVPVKLTMTTPTYCLSTLAQKPIKSCNP